MIPTPHVVNIYKKTGLDDWGMAITSTPVDYPAFVQYSSARIKTNEGEEVKVELNITFKGEINVQYVDIVEFKDIKKNPSSIEKIFDLQGKVVATKVLM